jgi:outer membrane protein OmpA-like peptidoglycan-associated protein
MKLTATKSLVATVGVLMLTLAGCASAPRTVPMLEEARAQLATARADGNAQKYAGEDLQRASGLLADAEAAARNRKDLAIIEHYAYLSMQTSKTAREIGRARAGEERVAQAATEREHIRLEARTREAEAARTQAAQATEAAQQATAAATQAQAAAQSKETELAMAQERTSELQQQIEEMAAQRSSRGLVVTLGDMMFDTGRAELKSGADRHLDMIATFLQQHPERKVLIEGFTDNVGGESYNQQLSERRAEAVRSALVSRGVDASRIDVAGYGEEYPVGTNADSGGRQLNRRVEVVLSNGPEAVRHR